MFLRRVALIDHDRRYLIDRAYRATSLLFPRRHAEHELGVLRHLECF